MAGEGESKMIVIQGKECNENKEWLQRSIISEQIRLKFMFYGPN